MFKKLLNYAKNILDMKNILNNLETDLGLKVLAFLSFMAFLCFALLVKVLMVYGVL